MFSKADLRHLSLVVAVVLLVAGIPSAAGFVVVAGPSRPELTINICQPIQTFDCVSNAPLARPATVLPEFVLRDLGSTVARETVRLVDYKVAPDTRPPKHPV
ncbi:MAG TPA: hypothetical protein VNE82_13900 [Candidatus Binataceae bacterium]|nr:hypothetical protein [Candidatus Binataceae bacterium]